MSYNPYPMYGVPQKSPQQMQEELNQIMAQYQNVFPNNNVNQKQMAVSEKGEFVKVASFDEVSDYPTRLDGTATLFFDFKNRVFWSKKFANGGHSIQAFKFEPINSAEPLSEVEEIDYTKLMEDVPDPTEERFSRIENTLSELVGLLKVPKAKKEKECVKDEI